MFRPELLEIPHTIKSTVMTFKYYSYLNRQLICRVISHMLYSCMENAQH